MFRELSITEQQEFREWARENYLPEEHISPIWHPIIQEECQKINQEARQTEVMDHIYND